MKQRQNGFSLAEVLVSMAILALISTTMVELYQMSVNTLRQGGSRIDLQQRTREPIRRVTPLLSTAIPPSATQEAIYAPLTAAPAAPAVQWSSTEDLFGNVPVDPRAPTFRLYELNFNSGTGELVLNQIQPPLPAGVQPRVVARNLAAVSFEHLSLNSIRMTVRCDELIRRAGGERTNSSFTVDTMIQIPYYTSD